MAEVRRVVPYDGYLFALTDPFTRVGTSPLADVPMLPWPRLPELIRARYLTTLNRWPELLEARIASASLLAATEGDPSRSLLWREVQRDLGVVDVAVAPFGDRYGSWGLLDLWRTDAAFTPAELRYLAALAPYVVPGLRSALARTFVDTPEQLLPVGPAVVVLDPDLQVRSQTAGAAAALLQLNPPDEPMTPIPAAAYNVAAALVAAEHGVPVGDPWARVHLGGSRWVTVKADRMADSRQEGESATSRCRSSRARRPSAPTSSPGCTGSRPARPRCSRCSPTGCPRTRSPTGWCSRSTRSTTT